MFCIQLLFAAKPLTEATMSTLSTRRGFRRYRLSFQPATTLALITCGWFAARMSSAGVQESRAWSCNWLVTVGNVPETTAATVGKARWPPMSERDIQVSRYLGIKVSAYLDI